MFSSFAFLIAKLFCMMAILFFHRLFCIIFFSYTKVVGNRFYDDSDFSANFTRTIFALISIFCESCF